MAETVNLIILGASGDLTHRLLLPGLGTLLQQERDLDVNLIGAAANDLTDDQWRGTITTALADGGCTGERAERIAARATYRRVDAGSASDLESLIEGLTGRIIMYFALPPAVSYLACEALDTLPSLPRDLYLAIEKPFGTDATTAADFNTLLSHLPLPEDHIFRVDHFLGKATVLNLLGIRFANRLFEPVWNADNVERIEITTDESLALEGRAGYYDTAGALKDMIQSHLLLVMSILCMEEIARLDALELRDLQAHVLRATHLVGDDPRASSRRARYTAGTIGDRAIPSYVDEEGVDVDRMTETLAEITVEIRNSRWSGVPIRLRSGKALGDGVRQIAVIFKPVAHVPEGFAGVPEPNVFVFGMTPEFVQIRIATNAEGNKLDLEQTVLGAELGTSPVRPYGEILSHILAGDALLSVRGDIAQECWRIVTPVLEAWANDEVPMDEYAAGSAGPTGWS